MALLGFFKTLAGRWNNWVGDRDMELAIRAHLTGRGYYGDSATLRDVRLSAVQRPGWLQVFVFVAHAKQAENHFPESSDTFEEADSGGVTPAESRTDPGLDADGRRKLFGIVRQDERYNRTDIEVFVRRHERESLFANWSEDLIQLRRRS